MAVRRLVWFRNDLRMHDHAPLLRAAQADAALAVYVFDARHDQTTASGAEVAGARRRQFVAECAESLRDDLRDLGSDLVLRRGSPAEQVAVVANEWGASEVHVHGDVTPYERDDERDAAERLERHGITLVRHEGGTLIDPERLGFEGRLPRVFSKFRRIAEKRPCFGDALPAPRWLPPAGARPADDSAWTNYAHARDETPVFRGGERAGEKHLATWMWDLDALKTYKETRNGMLRPADSSRLSPWLALGCLSPRRVHAEIKRYELERVANQSTYWLVFELLWRDYFRLLAAETGADLFQRDGVAQRSLQWSQDGDTYDAWKEGRTGIPLVDAAMRELALTGFMSNRARQNVASFFSKTLQLDWRWGAEWFEHSLIDYDPANNWGNWQYVAGVGTDPRDRLFNVVGQSERYDPDAEFIARWVPELSGLPAQERHAPWRSRSPPAGYPSPIIDLDQFWREQRDGR
jgi:deoxyribodipyrimidine photo-lyase